MVGSAQHLGFKGASAAEPGLLAVEPQEPNAGLFWMQQQPFEKPLSHSAPAKASYAFSLSILSIAGPDFQLQRETTF